MHQPHVGTHLTMYLLSSPVYMWSNRHTLEAARASCLISFFPLVWTWHRADLVTWRSCVARDKEQVWGLWYTKALEDLVCKCGQRMIMCSAGNLSSPLLLMYNFTRISQLWRGQDRELLVFSPTTSFPGARNSCLVGPFSHLSVPAIEPQH